MAPKPAAKKKPTPKGKATKPPVKLADMVVSQTEMAAVIGVSTRFLRELTADGTLEKEGAGYAVGRTVRAYADFLKVGSQKKSGSTSLDALREEKAAEVRMNRMRKDRDLIAIDEALGVIDEVTGLFVSSLSGLPAQITGVPRERQRLDEIFDTERQRLKDRFAERRQALLEGRADSDTEAEDDAS